MRIIPETNSSHHLRTIVAVAGGLNFRMQLDVYYKAVCLRTSKSGISGCSNAKWLSSGLLIQPGSDANAWVAKQRITCPQKAVVLHFQNKTQPDPIEEAETVQESPSHGRICYGNGANVVTNCRKSTCGMISTVSMTSVLHLRNGRVHHFSGTFLDAFLWKGLCREKVCCPFPTQCSGNKTLRITVT